MPNKNTMYNKTLVALAAATVLGSATAALAYEDPENRNGDRYTFLEQVARPNQASIIGNRNPIVRQFASVDQFSNEDPENRIGDRYASLEPTVRPVATNRFAGTFLTQRYTSPVSLNVSLVANEDVENKIADRYPALEPRFALLRGPTRQVTASRNLTTGSIRR